ncbi:MAG: BlaI/MecI/CopY family transcriptional regulator [Eubacteriales bacterium]|nr:BlaI/MecI/CopY family transcriptional regulator [Eubacteriales bacterium]
MHDDISESELLILEYLWSRDTPAKFSEIMKYCCETEGKEWKKQTINTFLSRLAQKGFIIVDKNHIRALYSPALTATDYYQSLACKIIDKSYKGSLKNFLCAFTGQHTLAKDEKEELLDYIERL